MFALLHHLKPVAAVELVTTFLLSRFTMGRWDDILKF